MKKKIILLLLITFCAILNFSGSFGSKWQMDDYPIIVKNPGIRITDLSLASLKQAAHVAIFRPVSAVSFALNYYFSELDIDSYHLTNIFIHVLSSILFFFLGLLVLNKIDQNNSIEEKKLLEFKNLSFSKNEFIALFASLIWLCAPISALLSAYIVQRMTLLVSFFAILTLLFYFKFREEKRLKTRIIWLVLTFFSFALGALSKESGFLIPLYVLLFEFVLYEKLEFRNLKLKFISLGIIFIVALAALAARTGGFSKLFDSVIVQEIINNSYGYYAFSPLDKLFLEPRVILYYLGLIFYGTNSNIHFNLDFNFLNAPYQIYSYLAILLFFATAIYSFIKRKEKPLLFFTVFFIIFSQLLESTVFRLDLAFVYRAYLFSFFVLLLVISWLFNLRKVDFKITGLILIFFLFFNIYNSRNVQADFKKPFAKAITDYKTEYKGTNLSLPWLASLSYIQSKQYRDIVIAREIGRTEWIKMQDNIYLSKRLKDLNKFVVNFYKNYILFHLYSSEVDKALKQVERDLLLENGIVARNPLYFEHIYLCYIDLLLNKYQKEDVGSFSSNLTAGQIANPKGLIRLNQEKLERLKNIRLSYSESMLIGKYYKHHGNEKLAKWYFSNSRDEGRRLN